jgi:hypothetical protein
MEDLMSGQASDAQIAAFLTALRMKRNRVRTGFICPGDEKKAEPFWDGRC